ncbi:uncharacterized protein LOC141812634 [Curcuma longa]|uniref:uncharacterized protein LOC141812634 n=1 Tax=Curcuma longa TaxID=136217 RepID=UPI003D9F7015
MHLSCKNREAKVVDFDSSVIVGDDGPNIATALMRERVAQQIHAGSPVTSFGGERDFNASLNYEALAYHLKVLAIAITYGGPVLLQFQDELKLAIRYAFTVMELAMMSFALFLRV